MAGEAGLGAEGSRIVRRIADIDSLNTELVAWQHATNTNQRQVQWQFTTADARVKLRHLYPHN